MVWPDGKENLSGGRTFDQQCGSIWHGRCLWLRLFRILKTATPAKAALAAALTAANLCGPPNTNKSAEKTREIAGLKAVLTLAAGWGVGRGVYAFLTNSGFRVKVALAVLLVQPYSGAGPVPRTAFIRALQAAAKAAQCMLQGKEPPGIGPPPTP